jgi:hypothetical protein
MTSGRYRRIWIYGENEEYLQSVPNMNIAINNALHLYSKVGEIESPKSTITVSSLSMTRLDEKQLTCANGHMLKNGDGCIASACKYSSQNV